MITFTSADKLLAHYKALSERLHGPRTRPVQLHWIRPTPDPVQVAEEPAKPIERRGKNAKAAPEPPPEPNTDFALPIVEREVVIPIVTELPKVVTEPIMIEGRISFADVLDVVVAYSGMRPSEIFARRRTQRIVRVRQLFWALAYKHCHHLSLPKIAQMSRTHATDVGYDHTTVLHAVGKAHTFPAFTALSDMIDDMRKKRTPS